MDNVERDPNNVGLKGWKTGVLTEQNGHRSWGKPQPNSKYHSVNEEGEGLKEISIEFGYIWGQRCR